MASAADCPGKQDRAIHVDAGGAGELRGAGAGPLHLAGACHILPASPCGADYGRKRGRSGCRSDPDAAGRMGISTLWHTRLAS